MNTKERFSTPDLTYHLNIHAVTLAVHVTSFRLISKFIENKLSDNAESFLTVRERILRVQFKVCHGSLYVVMWLADEPREFNLPTLPQRRITYVPEKLPKKYGVHSEEYLPIRTNYDDRKETNLVMSFTERDIPRPEPYLLHEWIYKDFRLKEEQLEMIQLNGVTRQVFIKCISTDIVEEILQITKRIIILLRTLSISRSRHKLSHNKTGKKVCLVDHVNDLISTVNQEHGTDDSYDTMFPDTLMDSEMTALIIRPYLKRQVNSRDPRLAIKKQTVTSKAKGNWTFTLNLQYIE
ncbi:hypothetical protein ANN_10368 [Periplaneta americana]|uniref:Uncharacterized protein n=1 Tax=Periplaneta americana TaxID=6978 RepID=A0ABQ8TR74_PERAM|nr:hypothetical protein ANN_10368 [Periplaneta americana]